MIDVLEEKKAENIVLIDLQEVAIFTDYFIICSATSDRMISALLEAVVDEIRKKYRQRPRVEGQPQDGWLLVDYGDLILHIFSPNTRDYYGLEDLWAEGKVLLHLQ